MGRSKSEIQEALDLFNKALQGDTEACITICEIIQEAEKETNGGKSNGKNKHRTNCRKKSKSG